MPLAPRLLALGLLLALSASAQPTFVTTVGGSDDDVPTSVALAPDGTVYVAGAFERTVDFDPADPNDAEDTFTAAGNTSDGYLASYAADGAFRWAIPLSGTSVDAVNGVATDGERVVVVGQFRSAEFDADPGPGTATIARSGETDGFVAAYTTDGDYLWAFPLGGPDLDVLRSVAIDDGDVFVGGLLEGIVDLDPSAGEAIVGQAFRYGLLVGSYRASDGAYQWGIAPIATTTLSFPLGLAVDGVRVYTTGQFAGTTDFDAGPGVAELTSTDVSTSQPQDAYLAAYRRTNGAFLWAGALGGPNNQYGNAIASDGTRVYVGGRVAGTVDFDPGAGVEEHTVDQSQGDVFDPFIAAYRAPTGAFLWANPIASTAPGSGSESAAAVAVVGPYLYAAGQIAGTADFDAGPGTAEAGAAGFDDAFIAAYVPATGAFVQADLLSGTGNERATAVAIGTDDVVVAGVFTTFAAGVFVDFDPGPGEELRRTNGGTDTFVAAYPLHLVVPTEVSPEAKPLDVSVRPNPSAGGAMLRARAAPGERLDGVLIDALGRRVAALFAGTTPGSGTVEVRLPDGLAPGTYLVRVQSADGVRSLPVTIMR